MSRIPGSWWGKSHGLGLFCAALAIAGLSGCGGSSDPFSYVQVHGTVTYDDGSLIQAPRLEITFTPIDPAPVNGNMYPRAGSAEVDLTDGSFKDITSHKLDDGLVPGKYKVTFKDQEKNKQPSGAVPPKYRDFNTTPIEIDTKDSPFTFKIPKPTAADKAALQQNQRGGYGRRPGQ